MSWISIDDVVGSIRHALATNELAGAANVVAPNPVRNAEFAKALGRVLGRPALVPVPRAAMRIALGEFAQDVLASARVVPQRLIETGYEFRERDLEPALRGVLGRRR
jgi:NAD dependent epimerase/dehydratase family enzyme